MGVVGVKYVVAGLARALVLGLLWVFFAGWETDYAIYGAVSVVAATGLSMALLPPLGPPAPARWPRRAWFSLRLAAWFLWQSASGGVDVARRAITATPDIEPTVVAAPVELPQGHALQLAMLMMNLMPGSMIQRGPLPAEQGAQNGEVVEIHTLSETLNPAEQWRQLQLRAGKAFS